MQDKIKNLYQSIYKIASEYSIAQRRNNVGLVKEIIPQIQEFVLWFLEGNKFGIEEELYSEMQNYLIQVLDDISVAIEQEDKVLLNDAVTYGLLEYLKMFVESEQEENEDVNL